MTIPSLHFIFGVRACVRRGTRFFIQKGALNFFKEGHEKSFLLPPQKKMLRGRRTQLCAFWAVGLNLLSHVIQCVDSIQCKDESGNDVDYWFAYKYPLYASSEYDGVRYSFLTSSDPSDFSLSAYNVTDADNSIIGVTLAPIYAAAAAQKKAKAEADARKEKEIAAKGVDPSSLSSSSSSSSSSSTTSAADSNNSSSSFSSLPGSSLGFMFYNDQWPDGTYTESYGHSKGVLAFDDDGGYFLQHSVPDFPNWADEGYLYGSSQEKYGQQLSCFSLALDQLNAVAEGMKYSGPWVYDYTPLGAKSSGNASLEAVTAVINGSTRSLYWTNASSETSATTLGGLALSVFAKTGGYGQDMIDQVVSPVLDTPLWSQSWLNSGDPLGPYCPLDGDYVVDTETLQYGAPGTEPWPTADDHAKWVVSVSRRTDWLCIVDNNRCKSQYTRGGLATCTEGASEWHDALKAGVLTEASCDSPSDDEFDDGDFDDDTASADDDRDDDLTCCYSSQTKPCSSGDVCCLSGCSPPAECSYTEQGCSGEYGQIHDCTWENDMCVVP